MGWHGQKSTGGKQDEDKVARGFQCNGVPLSPQKNLNMTHGQISITCHVRAQLSSADETYVRVPEERGVWKCKEARKPSRRFLVATDEQVRLHSYKLCERQPFRPLVNRSSRFFLLPTFSLLGFFVFWGFFLFVFFYIWNLRYSFHPGNWENPGSIGLCEPRGLSTHLTL